MAASRNIFIIVKQEKKNQIILNHKREVEYIAKQKNFKIEWRV